MCWYSVLKGCVIEPKISGEIMFVLLKDEANNRKTYCFNMPDLYESMIKCQHVRVMVRHSMRMTLPFNPIYA